MSHSPTLRRRRLSALLVRLREASGLTVEEATRRLEWSRGRLTHMERNKWTRPDVGNMTALLNVYGVTDPQMRETVLELARQSRTKGWWAEYAEVFRGSLPGFEAEASEILSYAALRIPGLLQTPDYMAAVMRTGTLDERMIQRRIEGRIARQKILRREQPLVFQVLIDQAALNKVVGGPKVMRDQLRHIVALSEQPTITVHVIPDSVGVHAGLDGEFSILRFPEDPSLVYLEAATSDLYLDDAEEVQAYTLIFDQVREVALPPRESVAFLVDLAHRFDE
ncbi:helix-turn-helix transcriptional regulator [Streptosporangium sp. NPDC020145]|uniref:helix-turn-helix domain-containing protein n=1 Tax=Streptosporangium sp. NPDC020145 TaxID=3154694 RepID=UPI0034293B9D